ncbi:WD repeat-containing protein 74-like [Clavelina lepadiformis]|uniref:WD repeat-containing protein 74-like n=1 Tax=Clavelina lepadiformis TaxID=159417 RepID=UPI0040425C54
MEQNYDYPANIWLGAETGLLKSVNLIKKVATNHFYKENYGKEQGICCMCWKNQQKESLFAAHKNGVIRQFDMKTKSFLELHKQIPEFESEKETVIGLQTTEKAFISATSSGHVRLWDFDAKEPSISLNAGANLECMTFNQNSDLLATGGKENLLRLWDINSAKEPIFKAKNVRPDWLQLRIPVWITNIKFLPDSDKVLTTTGTHSLRIYDPKSQARRPVLETEYSEYPITAAAVTERKPNQVIVGNTRGEVASFDVRKFKHVVRSYKGFAGSVRDIVCHAQLPYFFSCGLDRHLRVHHENSSKVVHKVYLKSRLNRLLATDGPIEADKVTNNSQKRKLDEGKDQDQNKEEEEMWKKMDEIEDGHSDLDSDSSQDNYNSNNQPIKDHLPSTKNSKKRKR